MAMVDCDAVILGGGHNGLVAASYLADAGMDVLLLERRDLLGGACATEELFPGYRFSSCSYICHLLQDRVIDELGLREHGFDVYHLDPSRYQPFPDGSALRLWDDLERSQAELARFSQRDAEAYPEWLSFWERAAGIIYPYFLTPPPTVSEIASRVRGTPDEALLDRLLTTSMTDIVTDFFESDEAQGAFIQAQDVGDPAATGSAWCYAYIKCNVFGRPENIGIVKGGMGGIANALARAARARGAVLQTGAEVSRILVRNGSACGVALADGTEIRSRIVVSNADPKRTFLKLLPAEALDARFLARAGRLKTRTAYLKFHAALAGLPDFARGESDVDPRWMAEIKICPSIDYFARAWDDARRGDPAMEPVMEVQIPSVYDHTMAPEGHHVMSVWVLYAPVSPRDGTWDERREEVGERLIDTLSVYAPNLRDILVDWSLFTPHDLEDRVGLTDGNIRHLDIVPDQFLAQRPLGGWAHYATPIENLYLCGAGTHPGGEVTGAPGHNAAKAILEDWG